MTQPDLHLLDNPVWSSLASGHQRFRLGGALACRYQPDVGPFAAVVADTAEAWQALRGLLAPGQQVALLALVPIASLPGFQVGQAGWLHQMIVVRDTGESADTAGILRLNHGSMDDAADMLDLAQRTKPGPFLARTHETGRYIGLREGGRLIAMAGERMQLDDYVEISAVCVDDAHRGKGLANRLIRVLQREIAQRRQTPFLHVFDHNRVAIALYERLGFAVRQSFHLTKVSRLEM